MEHQQRDQRVNVTAADAIDASARALVTAGAPADKARTQAAQLVEAELRGHPSHGIRRTTVLAERLRAGLIDPASSPQLTWRGSSVLDVDGRDGFGPVVMERVLTEARDRARSCGIVLAGLRRTHHLGMLAPYLETMSDAGMIMLALTTSEGLVHPWGGRGPLIGTNPVGIGIPSRDGALVLDMSTAAVSKGKIIDYAARGIPLPEGVAVDENGNTTRDASAAERGAISPFGGGKGYGLGLAVGALVGLVTGTAYPPHVAGTLDAERPVTKGDVVIVIDPVFCGAVADNFALADYFGRVRGSGVAGADVLIPGDRARRERARRLAEGIEIDSEVWRGVLALGSEKTDGN